MMTVRELCATLAELPPESRVGLLTLSRIGICVDDVATTCATVQPSIDDDGNAAYVWLVGAEPTLIEPPPIVSWPCSCGEVVVSIPNDEWADDVHPDHTNPAATTDR